MSIPPELAQALKRIAAGTHSEADWEALRRALSTGQIAIAGGERAVALGGSAESAVIVTGDGNVVQVLAGPAAEAVQRLSPAFLERLTERYLQAVAGDWAWLPAGDARLPLEQVFFLLQARPQPERRPLETPPPDLVPTSERLEAAGAPWRESAPPPPPVPLG